MFLYVSPSDSEEYYPGNSFSDFTVELPKSVNTENFQLALTHIYFKGELGDYWFIVLCDAVHSSVIKGGEDCVLGTFLGKGAVDSPQYHDLITSSVKRLRIKIKGTDIPAPSTPLFLTLHLREKP